MTARQPPGYGATKDAKRIDRKDAVTLTKIPVLPISYEDAQPILAALSGPVAPNEWRGSLPLTYHLGPGPAKVHLKLEFNWELRPAYNVIAKLKGSEYPDQWVIRGNHHDAWVTSPAAPSHRRNQTPRPSPSSGHNTAFVSRDAPQRVPLPDNAW